MSLISDGRDAAAAEHSDVSKLVKVGKRDAVGIHAANGKAGQRAVEAGPRGCGNWH